MENTIMKKDYPIGTQLPIGDSLNKTDSVKFLLNLSICQLETLKLNQQINELHGRIDTIKQNMKRTFYEEPAPPVRKPFPLKNLVAFLFFAGSLFMDYQFGNASLSKNSSKTEIWITNIIFAIVFISILATGFFRFSQYKAQMAAYQKAAPERIRARDEHRAKETKRINALKQELEPLEEELLDYYAKKAEIQQIRDNITNANVLAKEYCEGNTPITLLSYFYKGRVNNLTDAINTYHMEKAFADIQNEFQRQYESITRNYSQLLYQQNITAQKLSEQIESAKNELATQQLMDSLYTDIMLDNISRRI